MCEPGRSRRLAGTWPGQDDRNGCGSSGVYQAMMNAKVMRVCAVLFLMPAAGIQKAAQAEPRTIQFAPPTSEVAFRAYKLGLLPLDGEFRHFTGRLTYDPNDHTICRVDLQIDAASLVTDEPSFQDTVAGPDFLDVERFPSLAYTGTCDGDEVDGTLGMHGVVRPFPLSLTWTDQGVRAQGRLLRAAWGMTALPGLAGRTIRILVSIPLAATHAEARN